MFSMLLMLGYVVFCTIFTDELSIDTHALLWTMYFGTLAICTVINERR